MVGLRAFTLRTFFAGLTGIFTPYWIMLCYHLYTGTPEKIGEPFLQLSSFPPIDYSVLSLSQLVSGGAALLIIAICGVESLWHIYQDKVQTRVMLRILLITGVATLLCMCLIPSHFNTFFTMTLIVGSILGGHLLALTFNRFTRIFLWAALALWTGVCIFNVWMHLFNF